MKKKLLLVAFISYILGSYSLIARDSIFCARVDYRAGSTSFDTRFSSNSTELDKLANYIDFINSDSTLEIRKVVIRGSSSFEGSHERNSIIANKRLTSFEEYIKEKINIPDSLIERIYTPFDWDKFHSDIENSDIPHKDKILQIVGKGENLVYYSAPNRHIDRRILDFVHLEKGSVWPEIERRFSENMRYAEVKVFLERKPVDPSVSETKQIAEPDPIAEYQTKGVLHDVTMTQVEAPSIKKDRTANRSLSVKTNGIGWAMLVPNIALEYKLQDSWSINIPFYYSGGINYFSPYIKFRGVVVQPEFRYHFQKVKGLFTGVHAGIGWYNVAIGGQYRYQDADGKRPAIGGGIGVGYKWNFPSAPRWGLELELGAGAYDLVYDKFYNEPNGPMAEKGVHDIFVGIDKASVSVTFDIIKQKKGVRDE